MKPVNEGDPKSMDKFADTLERTIVVLKNNSLHTDLGAEPYMESWSRNYPKVCLKIIIVRSENKERTKPWKL